MTSIEKIRVEQPEDTIAFFNCLVTLDDGRTAEAGGWIYGPGMVMGDFMGGCDPITYDRAKRHVVIVPYNRGEMGRCSAGLVDDEAALAEIRELCESDEIYNQVGRALARENRA